MSNHYRSMSRQAYLLHDNYLRGSTVRVVHVDIDCLKCCRRWYYHGQVWRWKESDRTISPDDPNENPRQTVVREKDEQRWPLTEDDDCNRVFIAWHDDVIDCWTLQTKDRRSNETCRASVIYSIVRIFFVFWSRWMIIRGLFDFGRFKSAVERGSISNPKCSSFDCRLTDVIELLSAKDLAKWSIMKVSLGLGADSLTPLDASLLDQEHRAWRSIVKLSGRGTEDFHRLHWKKRAFDEVCV